MYIIFPIAIILIYFIIRKKISNYNKKIVESIKEIRCGNFDIGKLYDISSVLIRFVSELFIIVIIVATEISFIIKVTMSEEKANEINKIICGNMFIILTVSLLLWVLATNIKIENYKINTKCSDKMKQKVEKNVKKSLLAINLGQFGMLIGLSLNMFIVFTDVLGYKARILVFITALIIVTSILIEAFKIAQFGFILYIFVLLIVYLALIVFGGFLFGSYYYVHDNAIIISDESINKYLEYSIGLGINGFFNYIDVESGAEHILRLIQFISGKGIEWIYLGCFSTLFITKMTSRKEENASESNDNEKDQEIDFYYTNNKIKITKIIYDSSDNKCIVTYEVDNKKKTKKLPASVFIGLDKIKEQIVKRM